MKARKIYEEWISAIDLTKTRVVRFPSFIFLCGGPISTDESNFSSCRDLFYYYINENKCSFHKNIILAEKIFEYFDHSEYHDLLCFERDIAELSLLTVLFSESPGSLAEFGSFSVLETIKERLLVVMHDDHAEEKSFIWRGPALYLQNLAKTNGKENPIMIYNWEIKEVSKTHLGSENLSHASDLTEAIEKIIDERPNTSKFREEQLGHIMLLIISFLKIAQLATLEEIVFVLKGFDISLTSKTVKQYLSLLKSLGLIVRKHYRNYDFYIAAPQNDWFSWSYDTKTARHRDSDRWATEFTDFYRNNEKEKFKALRSYFRSTGKIGE